MPSFRESFIFRIETDEPAMFWTGHGALLLPADAVLPEPALALGAGNLINLFDLEQLMGGTAQRSEIILSGVSEETVSLATEEAAQVPGARVFIGRVQFDPEWQQEVVEWEWEGEGVNLAISTESTGTGRVRTLALRIRAGETTRSRRALAFFTAADQQYDFPDDTAFSHVAGLNGGTSRRWGPQSE